MVALRWPIIIGWVAALAAALVFLPGLGGSAAAPLSDIVPSDAQAVRTQERALQLFGSSVATDTVAVERNPRGLSRAAVEGQLRAADAANRTRGIRAAAPLLNVPLPGVRWRERETTIVTYLFLAPDLNLDARSTRRARLRRDAAAAVGRDHAGHLGRGPGPAGAVGRDRQGAAVDGGGDDPDDPRHRRRCTSARSARRS